jgi:cell wall assembly regulator SMI1
VQAVSDPRPALNALVDELTRRGSPLKAHLRPGVPYEEVAARLSAAGAIAHADVVALYAWHDGFDRFSVPVGPDGVASLFPSHPEFNPLEEMLAVYSRWRDHAEEDATVPVRQRDGSWRAPDPDEVWSRLWFPVFEGGGSEVIFISNEDADPGSVWRHPIQDDPRRLYNNLAEAADAMRQALIDGRLEIDSVGAYTSASTRSAATEI